MAHEINNYLILCSSDWPGDCIACANVLPTLLHTTEEELHNVVKSLKNKNLPTVFDQS